jgi:hypothetical protein
MHQQPMRELDEKDFELMKEHPELDRLDLDMLYVVRQHPGSTEQEIIEELVLMGWPREQLE